MQMTWLEGGTAENAASSRELLTGKLEVNVEKTTVVVFRETAAIRTETRYYKGQGLEAAPEYRDLSVMFY